MIEKKDKVWILTFEYAGIAKVGGLGEVPANQAKNLADQFDITVYIPSHGQIERLKKSIELERLNFNCVGQLDPSPLGINEPESSYRIEFYKGNIAGVDIVLLSGGNTFTSKYLDDKSVYNPDTIKGKLCLFSIGMRALIDYLIDQKKEILPDIIHMHDYHVVIPFLNIKQELIKSGMDVHSIITIHLLTRPTFGIDFYRACGIDDTQIRILTNDGLKLMSFRDIFTLCENNSGELPTVEKIGAFVSDIVTTVSQSYLNSDIIPSLGSELINFKSEYVWDGCDWEYDDIYQKVINSLGTEIRSVISIPSENLITRTDMKGYLLNYKIGHLSQSPLINSQKVLDVINDISLGNLFIRNGNVKSFSDTGPLVIATGRISPQKGFETIFKAIPDVIKVIPNAKFLLLILPTDYYLDEIKKYSEYVKKYPDNLRIIFGVAAELFHIAHLAADVYCALSRWEPFGIIALEAMSSRLPVIASKVGGLQESIIDVREDPENGTGILIEKDNVTQFSNALISFFKLSVISDIASNTQPINDTEIFLMINQIPDEIIKSRALLDKNYYNKIKDNCYRRVQNNFRWSIVTKKLVELYQKVKEQHSIS